ncbi:outer membrane protein assembly factor BamE domain-containing protein [Trinickia dinghuensis]|uniref:Outer membrane protein assembly factor BamE n=1 Tax=Trinickia dinghuensis TaxID=2291023 RepID=A0A3D8K4U0_9BURK|nr:outer membrane protein assembly factor BamE [Trinickia dinghuensis]RDU99874.1 outer membrane protein assembly factor BamE [Trinickia dinghuensis]
MKKIIASAIVAAAASFTLAGCVTGNASITDEQKVSSIQIGRSTTHDVENILGKPGDVELQQGGEQVWTYQTVKTNAVAFIPFANMMGKSEQENNLTVRFNSKGVVTAMGRGQHNM